MSKRFIAVSAALLACVLCAEAQTNLQTFFDLGKDRKYITTTFEMFKGDKWGDTFFFIDHYYTNKCIIETFQQHVCPTAARKFSTKITVSPKFLLPEIAVSPKSSPQFL